MSEREWHDGVVDVVDELVQAHGPEAALDRLRTRRQTTDETLQQRCEEGIAYIKREVQADDQD